MKQTFQSRIYKKRFLGFSLIELIAVLAVFSIMSLGALGALQALFQTVKANREQAIVAGLASQRLEVARNLPYDDVGTVNGVPSGVLPDDANPFSTTVEGKTYEVYYEVTYRDDPADGTILLGTDPAPTDYKQVKMFVKSVTSGRVTSFLTTAVPKGLEGTSSAGALLVQVFDASGQPVVGANVHIENLSTNPQIILDRQTDSSGKWIEVGLPAGVNTYHLVVTKTGYSSDQTYPITVENPNPIKPDATIVVGQVTQVSLSIDLLSNLTLKTVNELCAPVSGVPINVRGDKMIGLNPTIYKFNNDYTSSGGQVSLNNIEWDNYTPTLQTGAAFTIYGTSPVQQVNVLPNTSQAFTFVLGSSVDHSLRVIAKDASTGAPIEGANVHLQKGGSTPQDYYGITGGSVWVQTDWTGGFGQADWSPQPPNTSDKYFADDGNVDINSAPTGVRLLKTAGDYAVSGVLESSTFDTGTNDSDFTTITWGPSSQDPAATLKFQIASNNDNATWDYLGPDGTSSTFYTVPGTTISAAHDDNRYVRYKAYLSTTDDKKTPVLTSVLINYVSGCFTPGQVVFKDDITSGNNYDLEITATGYQDFTENGITIDGNIVYEVLMSP